MPGLLGDALAEVELEAVWQGKRYGATNSKLSDGTGPDVMWAWPVVAHPAEILEAALRSDYEAKDAAGRLTWMHLVREEFAEALKENDPVKLYHELKQVAALCVSWMVEIERRGTL